MPNKIKNMPIAPPLTDGGEQDRGVLQGMEGGKKRGVEWKCVINCCGGIAKDAERETCYGGLGHGAILGDHPHLPR